MSEREKPPSKGHDLVLLHGRTEDGEGLKALRARPGRVDLSLLRPMKEGRPIAPGSEIGRLLPREESPLLWNVETVSLEGSIEDGERGHRPEHVEAGREGPPRVSSPDYRRNWEVIFGGGPDADEEGEGEGDDGEGGSEGVASRMN
jgi:hypothetical protein